ncbi:MAG TPA: class I tRNA ligase family protein, partial [Candidatus Nanoarchaeia archaeon]|nr:class I tRNA ligase family protein [Candidatus Nanoarchaeia archaeon]
KATHNFDTYNTGESKKLAEQFFWHSFCDYYLEIVKHRLYEAKKDDKSRLSAQHTLYEVMLGILKLFAPIMPHVTEELYHAFYADKNKDGSKSIHITSWPEHKKALEAADARVRELGELAINIISEVRKYKAANKMSLKEEIGKVVVASPINLSELSKSPGGLKVLKEDILSTIKAKELEFKPGKDFKIEIEK